MLSQKGIGTVFFVLSLFSSAKCNYNDGLIYGSKEIITMRHENGAANVLTILDYGHDVEGIPTFEVVSASGDTSRFEITYSETFGNLGTYQADGPLPIAATMDTYRINRYNITHGGPKIYTNRLIQGGFRYQKLNLSSPGELSLRRIGVKPTVNVKSVEELPGSFSCSDTDLNRIWEVGARTAQLTQILKDTIPEFWDVTSEGALVESSSPQMYSGGLGLSNYSVDFDVKPMVGGFSAAVLGDSLNAGIYIFFNLENRTMTAHAGRTEVEPVINFTRLNVTIDLDAWHHVRIDLNAGTIVVSVDGHQVMKLEQSLSTAGSFGLGAALGHSALFRNLETTSGGKLVYEAKMTGDKSFLNDFYLGTNPQNTLLDGSRRDRIAWIGDIDMGLGNAFALNWGASFPNGSINLIGSFQTEAGFWIPTAKVTQLPLKEPLPTIPGWLIGHSFNLISSMARYYMFQGDREFAKYWAPKILRMYNWTESQSLPNGLFNVSNGVLGNDWNWFDPPQTGVISKFNAAYAYSLTQVMPLLRDAGVDTVPLVERLDMVCTGMNQMLWSDDLGAYSMSNTLKTGFSQDANALAIMAGVPDTANRSSKALLSNMQQQLFLDLGPMAFSPGTVASGWKKTISPFASGYHLRAAFAARDGDAAMALLKQLWAPMADPTHVNYTGTFWEMMNEWGQPGLGWETSMCHGFSAAPTSELMVNVLGIQPVEPGFRKWKVAPMTLGLQWAKGRHPTRTSSVAVDWRFDEDGYLDMTVVGAEDGPGTVHLPEPLVVPLEESTITTNGKPMLGSEISVSPGESIHIVQHPK